MRNIMDFISKLVESTDENKTIWTTLPSDFADGNPRLSRYVYGSKPVQIEGNYARKIRLVLAVEPLESYRAEYQGGHIYLMTKYASVNPEARFLYLCVQENPDSDVVELNTEDDYQPELVRLQLLIQQQIHNVDGYITRFLEDPST